MILDKIQSFKFKKMAVLWYNWPTKRFSIWNIYARAYDVISRNIFLFQNVIKNYKRVKI